MVSYFYVYVSYVLSISIAKYESMKLPRIIIDETWKIIYL
jgi:hypothetical protein